VRAVTESIRHEMIKNGNLKVRICEICPGAVDTEIFAAGGWTKDSKDKSFLKEMDMPALKDSDVSQTVMFMLMLPYSVNVTEMIVKPVGEKF
jgi:NADP-dependent 3-hydroxy acid dehydrogenase YdfG